MRVVCFRNCVEHGGVQAHESLSKFGWATYATSCQTSFHFRSSPLKVYLLPLLFLTCLRKIYPLFFSAARPLSTQIARLRRARRQIAAASC